MEWWSDGDVEKRLDHEEEREGKDDKEPDRLRG
jgi:hypothetical protein